jgi:hypothetical protein
MCFWCCLRLLIQFVFQGNLKIVLSESGLSEWCTTVSLQVGRPFFKPKPQKSPKTKTSTCSSNITNHVTRLFLGRVPFVWPLESKNEYSKQKYEVRKVQSTLDVNHSSHTRTTLKKFRCALLLYVLSVLILLKYYSVHFFRSRRLSPTQRHNLTTTLLTGTCFVLSLMGGSSEGYRSLIRQCQLRMCLNNVVVYDNCVGYHYFCFLMTILLES